MTAATGSVGLQMTGTIYNNNADCRWIVAPAGAKQVTMKLLLSTQLNKDFVSVYECADTDCANLTSLLGSFSGASSQTYRNVTSSTGIALVWFTSDSSNGGYGFNVWYASGTFLSSVRMHSIPGSV
jgi:hypothetical protein